MATDDESKMPFPTRLLIATQLASLPQNDGTIVAVIAEYPDKLVLLESRSYERKIMVCFEGQTVDVKITSRYKHWQNKGEPAFSYQDRDLFGKLCKLLYVDATLMDKSLPCPMCSRPLP